LKGEELLQIKERREAELLKIKGVVGVGIRNRRIVIYVEEATPEVLAAVPTSIEDIPVMVVSGTGGSSSTWRRRHQKSSQPYPQA